MSLIIKQIVVGLLSSFLLAIFLLGTTFILFPIEEWNVLWQGRLFDIPYIVLLLSIIGVFGIATGTIYGIQIRGKLHYLEERLEEIMKGQRLTTEPMEKNKDLFLIQQKLLQVENKLIQQTQLSQRLVSERTEEREKSLQEVVLQERSRLARELHDSVSQQLFAASMMMSAINEGNPPEDPVVKKQLGLVEKMIDQSQLEMRALLLHLRPIALKEKSLHEGMEELLMELRQKVPMTIDWKLEPLQLEKGVEDHLFRILQEAVSNALRHSKADHLNVLLIERDGMVIMRISDDGIGFNVEEGKSNGSYGLQNMHERAEEIGGTLKVVSVEGEGSRLEIKVPYRRGGEEND
ncbi:NarL family two-component system sensor histidine kinase LiaS [Evansella vedderi]|uniref:Sensor histidine kinase n=1 Tax=Evansella vedderi TaxID=38282 RepID=A0ABT9ZZ37_9BACI|nr:sensor histidine kinase [Evansella vedderi]MDQ0256502.1 NarL family two-component system sensor histidine kinase LiaS [Evansella vedderi]